ncbi:MAG: DEAD/DEAH box helicase [Rhodospirillaceae bacterium]|nr:DEAD/DEAH box helicase [Rhodospirillaceae bacterium]
MPISAFAPPCALAERNYSEPTPIQVRAIPLLLDDKDMLGIAQTGTGKTAAFALPVLQILAPTRELAILRRGVDILVATPGRLLDLMQQGHADLRDVQLLVLDEADRMLDMGFIRDVRKISAAVPEDRQSLLFSATMPGEVTKLAREILYQPQRIDIAPKTVAVEATDQSVHFIDAAAKLPLLCDLMVNAALSRVLVFTRTKHRANRVAVSLCDPAEFGFLRGIEKLIGREVALASGERPSHVIPFKQGGRGRNGGNGGRSNKQAPKPQGARRPRRRGGATRRGA